MNKDRRKALAKLAERAANCFAELDSIKEELESIKGEEEEAREALPDGFKDGEQGEKAQAAIDAMDEAYSFLDQIDADEFSGHIDTASE